MSLDEITSNALRHLRQQAAKETVVDNLHELVLEINALLDAVEERMTELEGGGEPR